jgi:hypothetical protein
MRFASSADLARQGYDCSPATPIRVLLASQEANAAAFLGDVHRARAALLRAERASEAVQPDSGVSAWSCPITGYTCQIDQRLRQRRFLRDGTATAIRSQIREFHAAALGEPGPGSG